MQELKRFYVAGESKEAFTLSPSLSLPLSLSLSLTLSLFPSTSNTQRHRHRHGSCRESCHALHTAIDYFLFPSQCPSVSAPLFHT